MPRDVEADVKVNDKTSPGLRSVEANFAKTGKKIQKDYEKFGTGAGEAIIGGIGKVAPKLAADLAGAVGDASRLGGPVLVAGIAASLPLLSGLIGAAVTGAAGGAGIVGGVALAVRDSRVQAAGKQLGANLLGGLQDRAGSFVQPVLQSIDVIEEKFLQSGDTIESIFQNSSKLVVPLVDSIGTAVQSVLSGIDTAVGRSGPVFESLGRNIENTGETLELFFDNMSAGGEASAASLDATFDTVLGVVDALGYALGGLNQLFGEFDKVMPLSLFTTLNELFGENADEAKAAADAVQQQNDAMQRGGLTTEQYEKDLELVNKALEDNARAAEQAASAQASLFSDTTRAAEALDKAKKAAKENGETLSENTTEGRANRDALAELASTYNRVREGQEKAGSSAKVLSGTLATQRANFIKVATSMTGSARKARQLADQLLKIPSPKPKVTLNTAGVASQARNAREEINQIKGKTVTVTVNVNASRLNKVNAQLERLQRAGYGAAGGQTFAETPRGQTVGGAGQIAVTNQLAIDIDGTPFRNFTARAVRDSERRTAFRNRVGRRVG